MRSTPPFTHILAHTDKRRRVNTMEEIEFFILFYFILFWLSKKAVRCPISYFICFCFLCFNSWIPCVRLFLFYFLFLFLFFYLFYLFFYIYLYFL
ncbi:hypothetical protein BDF14DRAFT_1281020 [Spinellus fusiger]|nr:hypothetical protein BDF14DRAFT_1281020 [Spinellus fusiger]